MTEPEPGRIEAVLFDLDGVLVSTVELHAECWRRTFEEFLRERDAPVQTFSRADYRRHVDGRSRYEGAVEFLERRGIELPRGEPGDAPGNDTACALANAKAERYARQVALRAPDVYPGSRRLLQSLGARGVRLGVVSASRHCRQVLESAQLSRLFSVRVDGNCLVELGLRSKPCADPFVEAARRLGTPPERAMVVEDAVAGVRAGRSGGFGWVVGVDRGGHRAELTDAGADLVVEDLRQVDWSVVGPSAIPWPRSAVGCRPAARY